MAPNGTSNCCMKGSKHTVTENEKSPLQKEEQDEAISRRAIAKKVAKVAYVAPAVFAVISAAERPALAQSGPPPQ